MMERKGRDRLEFEGMIVEAVIAEACVGVGAAVAVPPAAIAIVAAVVVTFRVLFPMGISCATCFGLAAVCVKEGRHWPLLGAGAAAVVALPVMAAAFAADDIGGFDVM